jgi:predicted AlkP superfamily phosphohydrolase/phosphomutase
VFLAFGDGIRRRNLGASIVDITPTILRLLGIEPQGFDGKVLNHVLSNSTC